MGHYDEKFEDFEPRISGDSSMMSPSYSYYNREACHTEDSFSYVQHMMSLGYHSQLYTSRSDEEFVKPTLAYIDKPLVIHLKKIEEGIWKSIIFIP